MLFIFYSYSKSLSIVVKSKTETENTAFRLFTSVSIKKDFFQLTIEVNGDIKTLIRLNSIYVILMIL